MTAAFLLCALIGAILVIASLPGKPAPRVRANPRAAEDVQ